MQATFEDELIEDAKAKRHSLTCEAVEIGSKVSKYCIAMLRILFLHHSYTLVLSYMYLSYTISDGLPG